MTFKLKVHQSVKRKTIQSRPLPGTIRRSWKLITTHNNNRWKCGILCLHVFSSVL